MMTLDEAFAAAAQLLDQRGQLLNGHLLRAVAGNKEFFREVRSRLIDEGLAEDRAGVGLVRAEVAITAPQHSGVPTTGASQHSIEFAAASDDDFVAFDTIEADWWLMTGGAIRGPLDLPALRLMKHHGEFKSADFVRRGKEGPWRQPDEIPELKAPVSNAAARSDDPRDFARPASSLASRRANVSAKDANSSAIKPPVEDPAERQQGEAYVPPQKLWSADDRAPGWSTRVWRWAVDIAGGRGRLIGYLATAFTMTALYYWWQVLPANAVIFDEFTTCHSALHKLHDRHAGRSEYAPLVEQYRPRVENLVSRLQSRATNQYPIQNELYLAGARGLLPWLDNPANSSDAEHEFDKHMSHARKLIAEAASGRSAPASQVNAHK